MSHTVHRVVDRHCMVALLAGNRVGLNWDSSITVVMPHLEYLVVLSVARSSKIDQPLYLKVAARLAGQPRSAATMASVISPSLMKSVLDTEAFVGYPRGDLLELLPALMLRHTISLNEAEMILLAREYDADLLFGAPHRLAALQKAAESERVRLIDGTDRRWLQLPGAASTSR